MKAIFIFLQLSNSEISSATTIPWNPFLFQLLLIPSFHICSTNTNGNQLTVCSVNHQLANIQVILIYEILMMDSCCIILLISTKLLSSHYSFYHHFDFILKHMKRQRIKTN